MTTKKNKIKKAKDIAGSIFMLYDESDKTGHWELNKATDAIYAYIKEIEESIQNVSKQRFYVNRIKRRCIFVEQLNDKTNENNNCNQRLNDKVI